jgi:ankyrin repeat protein
MTIRCLKILQNHISLGQLEAPRGVYAKQYYNICIHLAPLISKVGDHGLASSLFASAIKYLEITCADNLDEALFPLLCGLAECSKKTGDMTQSEECLRSAGELAVKLYGESSDEAIDLYVELRNVRDHIDMESNHRKRALVASTGPKMAHQRYDPGDVDTRNEREDFMAHDLRENVEEAPEYDGWTQLHAAAKHGQTKIISFFLMQGLPPDSADNNNETPLHVASRFGWIRTVELLVEKGADVNYANHSGYTPLHIASLNHEDEVAEVLLKKKANLSAKTNDGATPLSLALMNDSRHLSLLLLEYSADTNTTSGQADPLRKAIDRNFLEIARLLVLKEPHSSDKNRYENEQLLVALANSDIERVKLLLADGADVNREYQWERTPLHYAAALCDIDMVNLLLERGASLNATDEMGETPLHYAAAFAKADTVRLLCTKEVGRSIENDEGQTAPKSAENRFPDHVPTSQGAPTITLKMENSPINTTSYHRHTPLILATANGNLDAVQALLSCHADLTVQDLGGETCLHWACHGGDLETVKVFLDQGADWTIPNYRGQDALAVAIFRGHDSVVDLLGFRMSTRSRIVPVNLKKLGWLQR